MRSGSRWRSSRSWSSAWSPLGSLASAPARGRVGSVSIGLLQSYTTVIAHRLHKGWSPRYGTRTRTYGIAREAEEADGEPLAPAAAIAAGVGCVILRWRFK